jgi:4-hydroxy-3-polyprenylbenzoate decarboxylase
MVRLPALAGVTMIAAVSEDVDLEDQGTPSEVSLRGSIANRMCSSRPGLIGISPVYRGVMGIDATWKQGYPKALTMTEEVVRKVDERWERIWK